MRALPILVCSVLVMGCVQNRFNERLGEAEVSVLNQRRELEDSVDSPGKKLDWKTACKLLDEQNLTLRRARSSQEDLVKRRKRFAIEQLNPRLGATANLSSALGNFASLGPQDYGIRLLANFSIPNPFSIYAKRYSLELQYYMNTLAVCELERRLQASLYGYFLKYQSDFDEPELLVQSAQMPTDLRGIYEKALTEERKASGKKNSERYFRLAMNQLLNTPGENWQPDVSTLPKVSYENKLDRLDPENGYGRLALKQAAGQVEVSLASLWQIKMDKLPNFSTGVSVPTLYDSRFDENGFEADETRLFGSMNKSFDLTQRDAERAVNAEERADIVQENIRMRLEREIYQLKEAKQNYRALMKEKDQLVKLSHWMKNNRPPEGSSEVLLKRVNDMMSLNSELKQNELRLRQLDLEFWVWDESGKKSPF